MSEICDVYSKEIDAALAQSKLLLQRHESSSGQDGEGKSSGDLPEQYVRRFLRQATPRTKYVTSGYVVDPKAFKSEENLPQFDVIVADSNVPPLFSIIDGQIDIVPVDSVIAVFEVKRTLRKSLFDDANKKLESVKEIFDRNDRTKFEHERTAVAGSLMPGTFSPTLGVISLDHDKNDKGEASFNPDDLDFSVIDFAWSLSGWAAHARPEHSEINPTASRETWNAIIKTREVKGDQAWITQEKLGILRSWLATSATPWLKPNRIMEYYHPHGWLSAASNSG